MDGGKKIVNATLRAFVGLVLALAMGAQCVAQEAGPGQPALTLDDLLGGQRLMGATLSPDGRRLALIINEGEHAYVAVKALDEAKPAVPVLRADPSQHLEPRRCIWSGPMQLVCTVSGMAKDTGSYVSRQVFVMADGSDHHLLKRNIGTSDRDFHRYVAVILDYMQSEPDTVLIRQELMAPLPTAFEHDLNPRAARYNLVTGETRETYAAQPYAQTLATDGAGNVRLVAGVRDTASDASHAYVARGLPQGQSDWRELTRLEPHTRATFWSTCCVTRGTDMGYMALEHQGRVGLWRVDLADQHDPELVASDPLRDVVGYLVNEDRRLLGVQFDGRVGGPLYTDPEAQAMAHELEPLLPGRWNFIDSTTPDLRLAVVVSWGSSEPPVLFLLDRRGTAPKLGRIGAWVPGLHARSPGRIAATQYTAPDGQPALLDYVQPVAANEHPPLVLWLSGYRDPSYASHTDEFQISGRAGYSLGAQWLAAQGYAVAYPHLRESSLAVDAWQQPFGDWGGSVYQQLLAAERAAIAATGADPNRVCIIGEGYAGYTAMVAAYKHEGGLRCVATINGVSELTPLRKRAMRQGAYLTASRRPSSAELSYDEPSSPLRHAAEFRVPVLLLQTDLKLDSIGFVDTDPEQARAMAESLRKAGKAHKLVTTRSVDTDYLRDTFAELQAFLAEAYSKGK